MKKNKKYEVEVLKLDNINIEEKKTNVNITYKLEYYDNKNTIKDLLEHISEFSFGTLCPCFLKVSKECHNLNDKNNNKSSLKYDETSLISNLNFKDSIYIYFLSEDKCKCKKKKLSKKEEIIKIKKELEEKNKENEKIKNDNKNYKTKISKLDEEITELKLKLQGLEEKYKEKENIEKELNEKNKKLNEEINKL